MTLTEASASLVRREERDGVVYLTLDRPPVNVLTIAMMRELKAALVEAGQQPAVRAIVLRGQGKAFCAGVDIGEHQGDTLHPMLEAFDALIVQVLESPVPVVAAVHGFALGGGCELAAASDIVVIAEDARIGVPEMKLAVFPPAAAVLFPPLIGTHRAMEMILTGEPILGAEAARIGLANTAVPATELDAALEKLLTPLRGASAATLRLARRAVVEWGGKSPRPALEALQKVQVEKLIPSHDAQEGLRAFLEKRAPVWEHR